MLSLSKHVFYDVNQPSTCLRVAASAKAGKLRLTKMLTYTKTIYQLFGPMVAKLNI